MHTLYGIKPFASWSTLIVATIAYGTSTTE
uniref:Uncharacterized protein n=1 Tax=Siphoviridae sp. ct2vX3 TaxID=2825318 RepID=A0A8S5PZA3_9CAUD|nr:MAG TPA: hypothetical protein [Siphoviridae sp. ct2vX3]